MIEVNVQDAKTRLSDLLARAERGEEIVIARAGRDDRDGRFQLSTAEPEQWEGEEL